VDPKRRAAMGDAAVKVARSVNYTGAGTVEFIVAPDGTFYFLEMNTRLQVEHPVTEMVTGVDLVQQQIRIARGEPLPFRQDDLAQRGHAVECRVYAEDPDNGFLPSPGRILALRPPGGPGVRDDSGVCEGGEVGVHYDPLVSKLVAWGESRDEAIRRMRRAVAEYRIVGVRTTLPFFGRLLAHPDFVAGDFDTGFVERVLAAWNGRGPRSVEIAVAAAAIRAFEARREAGRARPETGGLRAERPRWSTAGVRDAHASRPGERS
ncbi:MAG TPA: acetyl-CoA carboxylase biotin carboxylase subunit, partial [Vicinamibacteria bacterium]